MFGCLSPSSEPSENWGKIREARVDSPTARVGDSANIGRLEAIRLNYNEMTPPAPRVGAMLSD